MILRRVGVALALLMGSFAVCKADTIGPLTFGSGFPFGDGALYGFPNGNYVVPLLGPGLYVNSLNGEVRYDMTYAFAFDLAPRWLINNMLLSNHVDYGGPEIQNPDFTDWGYAFAEKVVLCPIAGPCSSASTGERLHASALPLLSLDSVAGPGTGIFEIAVDVRNQEIATDGGISGLNIFLSQTPEPSSIWLLTSGIAGVPVVELWRRRNRRRCTPARDIGGKRES
jgi:hypothetical protein